MLSLAEKVDPKHCLILVVDVQNDFCHPEGTFGRAGRDLSMVEQMMPHLVKMVEEARRVGVPVIFIQTVHSQWTDSQTWLTRHSGLYLESQLCRPGTWGVDFYGVAPQEGELVVVKHRFSAFYGTDLDVVLRAKGIKTLIMTGFSTNGCVESTARDGFMRDYHIVLLSNCTAATSQEAHQAALVNMSNYSGGAVTSDEVLSIWKELPTAERPSPADQNRSLSCPWGTPPPV